jgi:chaperonin GroEL (HSP60 family)
LIENKTATSSGKIIEDLDQLISEGEVLAGYDVQGECLVPDMVNAGIIDSLKVV